MKKMIFVELILTFLVMASLAKADVVNMNISVNGTSNLNITVDADDTLARQMITQTQSDLSETQSQLNESQTDLYGTITGSEPKDLILEEIERGYGNPINVSGDLNEIKEICADTQLQQYLNQISSLPPLDFVDYMKGLGYDDESHVNFIWTICQQEYEGFGNNAEPVNEERCCDTCNWTVVIPARIHMMTRYNNIKK
jgi:hypothetical protein